MMRDPDAVAADTAWSKVATDDDENDVFALTPNGRLEIREYDGWSYNHVDLTDDDRRALAAALLHGLDRP